MHETPRYFARMMMQRLVFILVLLAALPAQAGNVFEVAKISVDATAESTSAARALALRQGQVQALGIAMRRLVKQEEWDLLPELRTLDIEQLVERFRVSNEKTATGRYLATLSVQFKPGPLRDLLREYGVAVTEVQSRAALLLPVLEDLEGLQAWGEHWWQGAWAGHDIENNPAPLMLPMGDLEDSALANAEDILIGDPLKLQALNARYGTETVVVAHALADIEGQLGVTAYIFGPADSDVIVKTYRTGAPHPEMARQAIADVTAILAERWKQVAAVASGDMQKMQIRAAYGDLADWTRLLGRLEETTLVRDLVIVELTGAYAYLDISHVGSLQQLADNLAQRGLQLGGPPETRMIANAEVAAALGVPELTAESSAPSDPAAAAPDNLLPGDALPAVAPSAATQTGAGQ